MAEGAGKIGRSCDVVRFGRHEVLHGDVGEGGLDRLKTTTGQASSSSSFRVCCGGRGMGCCKRWLALHHSRSLRGVD